MRTARFETFLDRHRIGLSSRPHAQRNANDRSLTIGMTRYRDSAVAGYIRSGKEFDVRPVTAFGP